MSESSRAAEAFTRLCDIVATLRAPGGCPWDREQTIDSLKPFVLEETYEVLDAIDRSDHRSLREELGDFVFEAVLLAQIEFEAGQFAIADSLTDISDKLVRRHPHVFARADGEPPIDSAERVRSRWEEIKAGERGDAKAKTLLSGIAPTLPALLRAYQIGIRAASVGFDWSQVSQVMDKIQEEVDELREVVDHPDGMDRARAEDEMGDLLFSIAHLSRQLGIEPETALRKANDKFTRRFTSMEQTIEASGKAMTDMAIDDLEVEWELAKERVDRQ
ncbi:MAG TPA: nucleoside triphosphate pyrophosphohydrolase [Vicinamibacterales bacterium]|jgi:MazG family protein